ncbi:hypothetical protein [Weissella confusa]|uniref:hypothetical protein n=1 Tax=Weissella confusa TaxID=1583 RepID=UPI0018F148F1|nr:hypothetical protein [Weissella confusa]MBJ7686154.1 hypothetical protein [Weissella confusa]MBJ7696433.1 hypothetical protein [Weissella confusa]
MKAEENNLLNQDLGDVSEKSNENQVPSQFDPADIEAEILKEIDPSELEDEPKTFTAILSEKFEKFDKFVTFVSVHKFTTGLILFVVAVGVILTLYYVNPNIYHYFFSMDNGKLHFQWIGLSTLAAAVGFLYKQSWERRKFNADTISKNRIDWMKTVRNVLAKYMVDAQYAQYRANHLLLYRIRIKADQPDTIDQANKSNAELNKAMEQFVEQYRLLRLYVSRARDNAQLNQKINEIYQRVVHVQHAAIHDKNMVKITYKAYAEYANADKAETIRLINELTELSRNYMRNEWKRAKKGE